MSALIGIAVWAIAIIFILAILSISKKTEPNKPWEGKKKEPHDRTGNT